MRKRPPRMQTADCRGRRDEEKALARGVMYRFLSAAYRYPDPANLRALRELDARAMMEALAMLQEGDDMPIQSYCRKVLKTLGTVQREELEQDHVMLFGHSPQGRCPPYEQEYAETDEGLQQPHQLSDLSAFYRAFGLTIAARAHERVDFLAVECEYMSFLCQKQAFAIEHADGRLAGICADAQAKFLDEHLGHWIPAFARRLSQKAQQGFYGHLARLTLSFVCRDCAAMGIQAGSEHLKLRKPPESPEECMRCPSSRGNAGPLLADHARFDV